MAESKQIACGKIGKPHGLRGECRFFPYNPDSPTLAILREGVLVLGDLTRTVHIEKLAPHGDAFLLKCKELKFRDEIAQWTHAELWISTNLFPEIQEEDAWYHYQLEGLKALNHDGAVIGIIHAVQNYGAGDLLVVRTARGDVDVPLMKPWVGQIDLQAGTIVVDTGWLDG